MAVVHVVNAETSKSLNLMHLVHHFVLHCLQFTISFPTKNVPGLSNEIAGAFYHFRVRRFQALAYSCGRDCYIRS